MVFQRLLFACVADSGGCRLSYSFSHNGSCGKLSRLNYNEKALLLAEKGGARVAEGVNVPYFDIGDSAFPLTLRSMKPFTHNRLTEGQAYFNYRLSSARMVVEQTFELLKGRFRILLVTNESSIYSVNVVTLACCILHNICIVREVTFKYEWILARRDIHTLENNEEDDVEIVERNLSGAADAKAVRNALTRLFENQI